MSNTRRALDRFSSASRTLREASEILDQARADFQENPEDENARDRFSQLSAPAGYPDVHAAAVAFQSALHSTAPNGHVRGWQGGEEELEALQQTAATHNLDPGLFVTPEGAGSKREHILQLTRVYGGKFLPGDGRSNMWDPQSHSFTDPQSADQFANTVNKYYPDMGAQVQQGAAQAGETGEDGQPLPASQPTFNVMFTHEALGEPYPQGTAAHAMGVAQGRSSASPHPHHVVRDNESGAHSVTLQPDEETQQVVQTFQSGQPMPQQQEQPEPEDEMQPEQEPQDQGQAAPQEQPVESQLDAIDKLIAESGFVAHTKVIVEGDMSDVSDYVVREYDYAPQRDTQVQSEMRDELSEMLRLYQNSNMRSLSRLDEAVPVDSNRGVTARGNSAYDKYTSPATRERVLKSREDEIAAFARSRTLPMSTVYAAVEASMRTGKTPDLGQYGLAGDDAVATKQFIISNILNVQGLEDVEVTGDVIGEGDRVSAPAPGDDEKWSARDVSMVQRELDKSNARRGDARPRTVRIIGDSGQPAPRRKVYKRDAVEEAHGTSKLAKAVGPFVGPDVDVRKRKPIGRVQSLPKMEDANKPYECAGCKTRMSGKGLESAHAAGECPSCGESAINIDYAAPKTEGANYVAEGSASPARLRRKTKGARNRLERGMHLALQHKIANAGKENENAAFKVIDPLVQPVADAESKQKAVTNYKKKQGEERAGAAAKNPRRAERQSYSRNVRRGHKKPRSADRDRPVYPDEYPGGAVGTLSHRSPDQARNPYLDDKQQRFQNRERIRAAVRRSKLSRGVETSDTSFDPSRYMAEGGEGMQSGGQKLGSHWAKHTPNRGQSAGAKRERRAAHKAGRQAGRAAADQGMADYEADREEREGEKKGRTKAITPGPASRLPEANSVDPAQFMAEGSGQKPFDPWDRDNPKYKTPEMQEYTKSVEADRDKRIKRMNQDTARLRKMREKAQRPQNSSVDVDASRYMAEEGGPYRTGGAPERAPLTTNKYNPGPHAPITGNFDHYDLLPKKVMKLLKKDLGERIHGMPRAELLKVARERGLLGTEEDVSSDSILGIDENSPRAAAWPRLDPELARLLNVDGQNKSLGGANLGEDRDIRIAEHDYQSVAKSHGGKYLGYVQPYQALYEFPSESKAVEFANHYAARTKSTPHVSGKRVSVDEPRIHESGHLGYAGNSGPKGGPSPHRMTGPTTKPTDVDEGAGAAVARFAAAAAKNPTVRKVAKNAGAYMAKKGAEMLNKKLQQPAKPEQQPQMQSADYERSTTDKILGIDGEDPRSQSWPKVSEEMRKLLNLEDNRYLAPKPGSRVEFKEEPVDEATLGGPGVGAFLGGGLGGDLGAHLTKRTQLTPPYDATVDVSDCGRDETVARMKDLLKRVGLRPE